MLELIKMLEIDLLQENAQHVHQCVYVSLSLIILGTMQVYKSKKKHPCILRTYISFNNRVKTHFSCYS